VASLHQLCDSVAISTPRTYKLMAGAEIVIVRATIQ
jgi:hypothetical protein